MHTNGSSVFTGQDSVSFGCLDIWIFNSTKMHQCKPVICKRPRESVVAVLLVFSFVCFAGRGFYVVQSFPDGKNTVRHHVLPVSMVLMKNATAFLTASSVSGSFIPLCSSSLLRIKDISRLDSSFIFEPIAVRV